MTDRIDDLIQRLKKTDIHLVWGNERAIPLSEIVKKIRQWAGEQKEAVKKSSEEWSKLLPEWRVIDPDGWDRKNLEASWSELITESEYMRRVYQSTCMPMAIPHPVAGDVRERVAQEIRDANDAGELTAWLDLLLVADRILALLRPEPGLREAEEQLLGALYMVKLLQASSHALRSYENGNSDPTTAKTVADQIDAALAANVEPGSGGKWKGSWICRECHGIYPNQFECCPACGWKLRLPNERRSTRPAEGKE